MTREYCNCFSAYIETDNLKVNFYRLYEDVTDPMSDALNKSWEATDDFIIYIKKLETTRTIERNPQPYPFEHLMTTIERTDVKVLDSMEIRTESKQVANHIWWLAKHGVCFDSIKQMNEANLF